MSDTLRVTSRPMCGALVRKPFRATKHCGNAAAWLVEFTTPDDGVTMRRRVTVVRCHWHRGEKWLPKGATQVTTLALGQEVIR